MRSTVVLLGCRRKQRLQLEDNCRRTRSWRTSRWRTTGLATIRGFMMGSDQVLMGCLEQTWGCDRALRAAKHNEGQQGYLARGTDATRDQIRPSASQHLTPSSPD